MIWILEPTAAAGAKHGPPGIECETTVAEYGVGLTTDTGELIVIVSAGKKVPIVSGLAYVVLSVPKPCSASRGPFGADPAFSKYMRLLEFPCESSNCTDSTSVFGGVQTFADEFGAIVAIFPVASIVT